MLTRLNYPTAVLGVGFVLLIAIFAAALGVSEDERRSEERVRHTLLVENQLSDVLRDLQDAETSQRGFLLAGDPGDQRAVDLAGSSLWASIDALARATRDNPRQQAALARLRPIARERLDILWEGIRARRRDGLSAAARLVADGRGAAAMRDFRRLVADMRVEEDRLLSLRQDDATAIRRTLRLTIGAGLAALLALTGFSVRDSSRQLRRIRESRDALARSHANLIAEAAAREVAEGQLRQLQKMEAIGQLTGGIAHDFNNMLAVVFGSLELARRRIRSDPPRAETCIDNAMEGAQRAAGLTARLLAFARQQPLAPNPLDPNKLVAGMSEMLHRTIGEHMNLETVLAGGLWWANVDARQLESALLNLCINSRDAMPEGGKLTIETANTFLDDDYADSHLDVAAGQYVMISVSDTGIGMSADVQQRAFDPFYTTKPAGRGTGLGLSQVFGFIKQSGGHIKIYSETDVGTTVKIYLPRWTGALVAAVSGGAPPPSPRAELREAVLVVEDDDRLREVTVEALRELGYAVLHAGSAEAAMECLELNPQVEMVITDIVLPGMTGRALADRMASERPGLKVLYMTGYTRNAVVHNGVLDAGVAFLQKPFTLDQLAGKVRQVLDGVGANRPGPAP